jgi:hypothetical protein
MSRNANCYCAVISLDLEKAFGSVPHDLLMIELFTLGFDDIVLHWFESYLSNRTQFVFWRKTKSKKFILKKGVPEGSLLGPKLFCIYIDDIFLLPLSGKLVLYADDSTLICKHKSLEGLEETINTDLYIIQKWLQKKKLKLNKSKCNYLLFGSTQDINIRFSESPIIRVSETKILGVIFDENLNFAKHIEYVDKKLKNHLRLIARIRHFVPLFVRNLICKSVMFPVMNYGIQVWGHTYDRHLKSLEVTQRTAAKLLIFSKIGVDCDLIFKNLKWISLKESIDYFS